MTGIHSPHLPVAVDTPDLVISVSQDVTDPGYPNWRGFGTHTGSLEALGGVLRLDRDARTAVLHRRRPVADELLVHPLLGMAAGVFNWWQGRETLHAGAVAIGGYALGILAPKLGGKTTLLAGAMAAGHDLVTDDVLVVADGLALPGPRCLDLRPGAAAHLGVENTVSVRRRARVAAGHDPGAKPIVALVSLAWGARQVALLPPTERYRRIVAQSLVGFPGDVSLHLALARLPMWELRRRRSWDDLAWSVEQLAALASVGVEPGLLEE